jgi:hypothetical protein
MTDWETLNVLNVLIRQYTAVQHHRYFEFINGFRPVDQDACPLYDRASEIEFDPDR